MGFCVFSSTNLKSVDCGYGYQTTPEKLFSNFSTKFAIRTQISFEFQNFAQFGKIRFFFTVHMNRCNFSTFEGRSIFFVRSQIVFSTLSLEETTFRSNTYKNNILYDPRRSKDRSNGYYAYFEIADLFFASPCFAQSYCSSTIYAHLLSLQRSIVPSYSYSHSQWQ